ncbi:esterase [Brevibacillus sp. SKDU10]|uniref:patatin-like phospholipase family protein n=1 Tax=Brevibacillus sp. SKDU10 TaxID=1247872 RepID=UPI0007C89428|nr:patatin-like phospholipase family protein [Brevibacillus sp. SKDU10]OAJ73241.1 esterase [Brevibacillus sp. SKDU10]
MTDKKRPTIGLALGAGGARGFAHIGILKVLEEHDIPVDFIAGSSMGSLVGAFYANGIRPDMMEKLAINLKRKHWLDLVVPHMGLVAGQKIKEIIRLLTHGKNIEELQIPLAIVATDIETGERVVFTEGPVDIAVRSSIAMPGIFVPERVNGRMLVDGGVIDRVPITVTKEMGADLVLAIDVANFDTKMKVSSIFDVIAQTIDVMEREILRHRMLSADLVIRPEVGHIGSLSFTQIDSIVELGEIAARKHIDQIKEMIKNWEETDAKRKSIERALKTN